MVPLLEIRDLGVAFRSGKEQVTATEHVSLTVNRGEIVAVVGESGSGKSVTALSLLRLLPADKAVYPSGELLFSANGDTPVDLLKMGDRDLRKVRGSEIAMIFQEPMTSLNPVFTCGDQVAEAIMQHTELTRKETKQLTIELFEKVQLPDPVSLFKRYPHEVSGGQKQRVMIAMAICCQPRLLIADEPTTALDVTVQKGVLELLASLQAQTQMGMIFITHDLGVVRDIAHRVVVMYRGTIVEENTTDGLFNAPKHPYTKALLACRPILHHKGSRLPVVSDFWQPDPEGKIRQASTNEVLQHIHTDSSKSILPVAGDVGDLVGGDRIQMAGVKITGSPLLRVTDLRVWFPAEKKFFGKPEKFIKAVDGVSFDIFENETLGVVGESGCGKTTLGRTLLCLQSATNGSILHRGKDLLTMGKKELQALRKDIQVVFQDPYASLNPRLTIGEAIREAMEVHEVLDSGRARKERVVELLEKVNLKADHFNRYPHAFSGGQRQRIGIARALALNPGFIVFDESVSALDVSVQAQVLNLVNDLKAEFGFTAMFISHDLGVVRYISDRILVMNKGVIEEIGQAETVFSQPASAYTRKLLEAIPGNKRQSG